MPGAGERRSLFLLARHGNRDMLAANDLVVGRIKSVPARAGNVDFRPSMRGAVLTFAHLDVASDESRPEPPMPRAFHHEHREVAARSTAEAARRPPWGGRATRENSSKRHPRKFSLKRFLAVRRSRRGKWG